ncbi:hypothetical protein, partial [Kitasatospora nipponensis]|uniref:hypothetical protein n=1 Tax=Kitasatospora nipponensis TaxID=258049 RepID=UPI0031E05587
ARPPRPPAEAPPVPGGRADRVGGARTDDTGADGVYAYGDDLLRLQAALADMQEELAGVLRIAAGTRPLAVLVDDLQAVLDEPAGFWLLDLLAELTPALVVHARRPECDLGPGAPAVRGLRLGPMTAADTRGYTVRRLLDRGWQSGAARACAATIHAVTGGHPIDVATCCEIVAGALAPDTPPGPVREHLLGGDLRWGESAGAVRGYVDGTVSRILGREVELFDRLVVLRRCTLEVLRVVLPEAADIPQAVERVHDRLGRCGFVTAFDDDRRQGWRLHDYLRQDAERRLRAEQPERYAALHRPVEAHYREALTFDTEIVDEESAHAVGCRFEDPRWQQNCQEWLHHVGLLPPADRAAADRSLIRLFVEVFWWWDAEVPSRFCGELLAAYRALPDAADRPWIAWLDDFRAGYVAGREQQRPGRDAARWAQAAGALDRLGRLLGIRRARCPQDGDRRRIHLLFCCLAGDVAWYGSPGQSPDAQRAAQWYRAAAESCTAPDEHWIGSWALWCEAQVWLGVAPERSRDLLAGIEERIDADQDNELRALVAGTFGDLCWVQGRWRQAFDCYARAALHAFVYNVRQETVRQLPSDYTVALYHAAVRRVEERCRQARAAGEGELVEEALARMRDWFAPYWRLAEDQGPGAAAPAPGVTGLPPGAQRGDLGRGDTPFAERVGELVTVMRRQLAEPLQDPLYG